MSNDIRTPPGAALSTFGRGGGATAKLTWDRGFGPRYTRRFSQAQRFVDSEILRRCAPYVPMKSGALLRSGESGTVIGSGQICWDAPYAAAQYYGGAASGPLRGGRWFERMKADHQDAILRETAKIAGGSAT